MVSVQHIFLSAQVHEESCGHLCGRPCAAQNFLFSIAQTACVLEEQTGHGRFFGALYVQLCSLSNSVAIAINSSPTIITTVTNYSINQDKENNNMHSR